MLFADTVLVPDVSLVELFGLFKSVKGWLLVDTILAWLLDVFGDGVLLLGGAEMSWCSTTLVAGCRLDEPPTDPCGEDSLLVSSD